MSLWQAYKTHLPCGVAVSGVKWLEPCTELDMPLARCSAECRPGAVRASRVAEGDMVSGPGVVIGCFSTCSADITTASRL